MKRLITDVKLSVWPNGNEVGSALGSSPSTDIFTVRVFFVNDKQWQGNAIQPNPGVGKTFSSAKSDIVATR